MWVWALQLWMCGAVSFGHLFGLLFVFLLSDTNKCSWPLYDLCCLALFSYHPFYLFPLFFPCSCHPGAGYHLCSSCMSFPHFAICILWLWLFLPFAPLIQFVKFIHLLDLLCLSVLTISALVACCVWKYWSQSRRPCIRPQHTQPMWLSTWQSILLLQLYPCHYFPVAGFSLLHLLHIFCYFCHHLFATMPC